MYAADENVLVRSTYSKKTYIMQILGELCGENLNKNNYSKKDFCIAFVHVNTNN